MALMMISFLKMINAQLRFSSHQRLYIDTLFQSQIVHIIENTNLKYLKVQLSIYLCCVNWQAYMFSCFEKQL